MFFNYRLRVCNSAGRQTGGGKRIIPEWENDPLTGSRVPNAKLEIQKKTLMDHLGLSKSALTCAGSYGHCIRAIRSGKSEHAHALLTASSSKLLPIAIGI